MADGAAALTQFVGAVGLDRFAVHGSHVGAARRAGLLDGCGMFAAAERDALQACYAPAFAPGLDGACLARAFMFVRDRYLFFP